MRMAWAFGLIAVVLLAGCWGHSSGQARAGAEVYRLNCASCHGVDARGNGPVAPFIKATVPDLTRIAARRGGTFPPEEIYKLIDGQSPIAAHGPRQMPVWGYEFFDAESDDQTAHKHATERVEQLVAYLGTLQRAD